MQTFIAWAYFSVQSEWAAIHSITLHVGKNSWKAQTHTHICWTWTDVTEIARSDL